MTHSERHELLQVDVKTILAVSNISPRQPFQACPQHQIKQDFPRPAHAEVCVCVCVCVCVRQSVDLHGDLSGKRGASVALIDLGCVFLGACVCVCVCVCVFRVCDNQGSSPLLRHDCDGCSFVWCNCVCVCVCVCLCVCV